MDEENEGVWVEDVEQENVMHVVRATDDIVVISIMPAAMRYETGFMHEEQAITVTVASLLEMMQAVGVGLQPT